MEQVQTIFISRSFSFPPSQTILILSMRINLFYSRNSIEDFIELTVKLLIEALVVMNIFCKRFVTSSSKSSSILLMNYLCFISSDCYQQLKDGIHLHWKARVFFQSYINHTSYINHESLRTLGRQSRITTWGIWLELSAENLIQIIKHWAWKWSIGGIPVS